MLKLRIAVIALVVLAAVGAVTARQCLADNKIDAPDVRVWTVKGTSISEGEVVLAAAPEDVYAAVTDYPRWTDIFPYIARVKVKSAGTKAVIETTNRKGHKNTLKFDNDARKRTVRFDESSGPAAAHAEIVFEAGAIAGTTRVRARLRADVDGVAGWFVSDATVRRKREHKLTKDLESLRRYFAVASR